MKTTSRLTSVLLLAALAVPAGAQVQKLTADDADAGDWFGGAVATDGNRIVVGARNDGEGAPGAGAAYVYDIQGCWKQTHKLMHDAPDSYDYYGTDVDIEANKIIVGVPNDDDESTDVGAAFIYGWNGSDWIQLDKLTPHDASPVDLFGTAVGISGEFAAVGAYQSDAAEHIAGAVYMYRRNGGNWDYFQTLTASDASVAAKFGLTLDIEGDSLVVGAEFDSSVSTHAGSAYVFHFNGTDWVEDQKLLPASQDAYDYFGCSVAIEGKLVAVGTRLDDEADVDAGAVYMFERAGGVWSQVDKLMASDAAAWDEFGSSVDIDGTYVSVGSPLRDDAHGDDSGTVYGFEEQAGSWIQDRSVDPSDHYVEQKFGDAIATRDGMLVAATRFDDEMGTDAGAAYVFGGPDITLSLTIEPPLVPVGSPFTMNSECGQAGGPLLVWATAINGISLFKPLLLSSFDADGAWELTAIAPPVVAGLLVDFQVLGSLPSGAIGRSPEVQVQFQ